MTRTTTAKTTARAAPQATSLAKNQRPRPAGLLPMQEIRRRIGRQILQPQDAPIDPGQIQPASLDLRLGACAYRLRASFLPGENIKVHEKLESLTLHIVDLTDGAVLETGCVYVIPLLESIDLGKSDDITITANPKSSVGRLDVFVRLITDHAASFDDVPPGYRGPLYLEVSPRSFPVLVRQGTRLVQIRLCRGSPPSRDTELRQIREVPLVADGAPLCVSLKGQNHIGWRAKRHAGLIDVDKINTYRPRDFWEPIQAEDSATLVLDPHEFYILASREAVRVPPDYAAQMVPYDPLIGEFRAHYAGFFDPGFGHHAAGGAGSRAVLEMRSHDVPFILEDGQIIGRLIYEKLTAPPDKLYGADSKSNYQAQGLKLSKHFQEP